MNIEKKVLCKNSYITFRKGCWYDAILYCTKVTYNIYFVYDNMTLTTGRRFDDRKDLKYTPSFSDYFYSDQELRKEKLKKIAFKK